MMLAVLTAAGAVALGAAAHVTQRIGQARAALTDGQERMANRDWDGAVGALERGLSTVRGLPGQQDLIAELGHSLDLAEQGRATERRAAIARELHQLADRTRFLYGADPVPPDRLRGLEVSCREFWENRGRIVARLRPAGASALEPNVRDDLLALAIFWADLQVRLASPAGKEAAHGTALTVLAQAEELLGPSPMLDAERQIHRRGARGEQTGMDYRQPAPLAPRPARPAGTTTPRAVPVGIPDFWNRASMSGPSAFSCKCCGRLRRRGPSAFFYLPARGDCPHFFAQTMTTECQRLSRQRSKSASR